MKNDETENTRQDAVLLSIECATSLGCFACSALFCFVIYPRRLESFILVLLASINNSCYSSCPAALSIMSALHYTLYPRLMPIFPHLSHCPILSQPLTNPNSYRPVVSPHAPPPAAATPAQNSPSNPTHQTVLLRYNKKSPPRAPVIPQILTVTENKKAISRPTELLSRQV